MTLSRQRVFSATKGVFRSLMHAPRWALQLLTSAKSFCDNPILGSRRLNRVGLHRWRTSLAHASATRRRRGLASLISAEDKAAFNRDGFVLRPNLLPSPVFNALRERLLAQPAACREMQQGDTITRRIAVDSTLLRQVPELNALFDHPAWSGLTRYVAAYHRAPWVYVQSILSRVCAGDPDPQTRLHADTFHPTMKAWFFLTDVDEDQGPFCYVPGSHRLTPQRLDWEQGISVAARHHPDRLTSRGSFRIDAHELSALHLPPPRRFAVAANTLIVADTFGFHARAASEGPSLRIELWAYDRRNPYFPWTTDGVLEALGLTQDRAPLYWKLLDRLAQWKLKANPWRDSGIKTAGAPPSQAGADA